MKHLLMLFFACVVPMIALAVSISIVSPWLGGDGFVTLGVVSLIFMLGSALIWFWPIMDNSYTRFWERLF